MKYSPLIILTLCVSALSANAQDSDVKTSNIKNDIHLLVSPQGGNVVVSTGEDGTFLIDDQLTGRSEIIKVEAKKINDQNIKFILNTHYHFDHTGGNEYFGENDAVIIAHDSVRKRLSTKQFITHFGKEMLPLSKDGLPKVTFSKDTTLHYNNEEIKIIHFPKAHTDGDVIAHFANSNVIVAGDLIFNGMYPFIDTEHGGSINGLLSAHEKLLSMSDDETIIIPGHGDPMTKNDLKSYYKNLKKITDSIKTAIAENRTLEQTIAAKPTKEFDVTMGNGVVKPDAFTSILYNDLVAK
ncbi:MAG: MBL fold metallo-hydrolase [Alphaproteobacteria bacterium]